MAYTKEFEEQILNSLSAEDRIFCLKLFTSYQYNLSFINSLASSVEAEKIQWYKGSTDNFFTEEIKECITDHDFFNNARQTIAIALLRKIEKYFIEQYCISFVPHWIKERNFPDVTSIVPIIDNIFKQCGHDLVQSGRLNIINNFHRAFYYPEDQPELNGNKINLPTFLNYDNGAHFSLKSDKNRVKWLLHALCLCFLDKNTYPQELTTLYKDWSNEIDIKKSYQIFNSITIKFFYNRKVSLRFQTHEHALKFWNLFELDGIAERRQRENP